MLIGTPEQAALFEDGGGRAIKSLMIVDDGTHEVVAIGQRVVRILERIGAYHGLPTIIRTDNSAARAMLMWAHQETWRCG